MDVARYDIFKLSEAMLSGNAARFAHILDGLRAEGTATVLVLWAISEDIRTLGKVLQASAARRQSQQRAARHAGARDKQGLIETCGAPSEISAHRARHPASRPTGQDHQGLAPGRCVG